MDSSDRNRRRELIAAYKRTARAMGVYRITNRVTGHSRLASSRDLHARLNRHRMNLRTGSEPNAELQREWNAYGADAFEFEIVDELEPHDDDRDPTEELNLLESLWLERLPDTAPYRPSVARRRRNR